MTDLSHLRTRPRYWWDNSAHKISAHSNRIVKSYRVNGRTAGRTDTLTDSIVYSLFEYTKNEINLFLLSETWKNEKRLCKHWQMQGFFSFFDTILNWKTNLWIGIHHDWWLHSISNLHKIQSQSRHDSRSGDRPHYFLRKMFIAPQKFRAFAAKSFFSFSF